MSSPRTIILLFLLLLSFWSVRAQNVINLNTQVLPPFSPYWTDYLSPNNKLILLLTNNVSNEPIEVRLQGEISGNNGITLSIPPDYIPPLPITIMPRQTLKLSGPQLLDHLNLDIFQISGSTLPDLRSGNGLPEGNYKICLRAVEYRTGRLLSLPEPMGCGYFNIRQLEPPIILQPACGQDLLAHELVHTRQQKTIIELDKLSAQPEDTNWEDGGISGSDDWASPLTYMNPYPQNILFSWTIPAGANPANTEYVLTIVEMYPQDIDPNQAMLAANQTVLFEKVLQQNVYLYNQADPLLERGRKYAFRVTARPRDPLGFSTDRRGIRNANPMFRNNGHSVVCHFIYGTENVNIDPFLVKNDSTGQKPDDLIIKEPEPMQASGLPTGKRLRKPLSLMVIKKSGETARWNFRNAWPAKVEGPSIPKSADNDNQIDNFLGQPIPEPVLFSGCQVNAVITNTSPIAQITAGNIIQIGDFSMEVVQVSKNTFPFSGTGRIAVNFLNTQINVEFQQLAVNTDFQVYDNNNPNAFVRASADHNSVIQGNVNDFEFLQGLADSHGSTVMNLVNQIERSVSNLSLEQSIGMPLGLDKGQFYTIAIVGMRFEPDGARLNAFLSLEVPETFNQRISLTAANVCFNPNELGEAGILVLQEDLVVPLNNNLNLELQGGESNSFAEWSAANGYQQMQLTGALQFSSDLVQSINHPQVEASFSSQFLNFSAWSSEISFNGPFTVPGLPGFELSVANAIFDHSEIMNQAGTSLPADHGNYYTSGDSWKGIFIESLTLTLPDFFENNGDQVSFNAENMVLDKTGFSGSFSAENLLSLAQGGLDSWPFSIETFQLNIVRSSLNAGTIEGQLRLPVSDTNLEYTTTLASSQDGLNYQFVLQDILNLELPLWLAQMQISNSSIGIEISGDQVKAMANLNGELSINWGNSAPLQNISLLNIGFNNFVIDGASLDLSNTTLAFGGSGQQFLNFPIGIQDDKEIVLNGNDGGKVSIQFPLEISLDGHTNGVGAATTFKILGTYDHTGKKYVYDDFLLEQIKVDADLGMISFAGEISRYDNDSKWGNGFTGKLTGEIPGFGLQLGLAAQFGTTSYNSASTYRYWFVDAKVLYLPGFNIPATPLSIYGFGGGAYRNMTRVSSLQQFDINNFEKGSVSQSDIKNINLPVGETLSGAILDPEPGNMGLRAELVLGMSGISTAMNGDLSLGFEFPTDEFGGSKFILEGRAYVMTPLDDREKGYIKAKGMAVIEGGVNPSYFDMLVQVDLDVEVADISLAEGGGSLQFHASQNSWFLKIGDYTPNLDPFQDDKRIYLQAGNNFGKSSLNFRSYFVAGKDVFTGAPGLPAQVLNAVEGKNVSGGKNITSGDQDNKFQQLTSEIGQNGFAFGAAFSFSREFNFLILYAKIEAVLGADLAMLDKSEYDCYQDENSLLTSVGINDWYATGSIYGYLGISGGIGVDLWFYKGQIEFFNAGAGFLLEVQMPNPYFMQGKFGVHGRVLGGLIKVNQNFEFKYGKKCQWIKEEPFDPFDIDIITDLQPKPSQNKPPSIFSYPEAAFNFQMDKTYSFTDDVTGKITRAKIGNIKLTLRKGNTTIQTDFYKAYNKESAWIVPDNVLEGNTTYTFIAEATGHVDYPDDGKGFIVAKNEKKEITFTTGPEPKHIVLNNVKYAYPIPGQRYFLKDMDPKKGRIELLQGRPNLFSSTPGALPKILEDDPVYPKDAKYQQLARFTELETGKIYVAPLTYDNAAKTIYFELANQLKNETIYSLEIINRFDAQAIAGNQTQEELTFDMNYNMYNQIDDSQSSTVGSWTETTYRSHQYYSQNPHQEFGGLNQATVMVANKNFMTNEVSAKSGNPTIDLQEIKLTARRVNFKRLVNVYYQQYFRTSKYNTPQQKFNSFKVAKTYVQNYFNGSNYHGIIQGRVARIMLTTGENLDEFEAYGASISNNFGNSLIRPLVNLAYPVNDAWYTQLSNKIYSSKTLLMYGLQLTVNPVFPKDRYFNHASGWLKEKYYNTPAEEAISFYRYSRHGAIGVDLNADEQIWQPDGRLTPQEIEAAKKLAEPYIFVPNKDIGFTMIPDIQTPGSPFAGPGVLAGAGGGGSNPMPPSGGSATPFAGAGFSFGEVTNYLPLLFYVDMVSMYDFLKPQKADVEGLLLPIQYTYYNPLPYTPLPFKKYSFAMKYQRPEAGGAQDQNINVFPDALFNFNYNK